MEIKNTLRGLSRKFLLIILSIILLAGAGYYLWQKYKFGIVGSKLQSELLYQTDSLYKVEFDSLYFDEVNGEAFLKNIRIIPDTQRVKDLAEDQRPLVLVDIRIKSLTVKGINTADAVKGSEIVGDSIIIDHPDIVLYFLKRVKKETKIEREAVFTYKQILGNLELIDIKKVVVNNASVKGIDFATHHKDLELSNANIHLFDVRIDSLQERDTSRTLFCKYAYLEIDSFKTFDNSRQEAVLRKVLVQGNEKRISVERFSITRHVYETGPGELLAEVDNFLCVGVHANAFIREKHIQVDSIWAGSIGFYRQAGFMEEVKSDSGRRRAIGDTSGFSRVYSAQVDQIYFPAIHIRESPSIAGHNKMDLGEMNLKIRNIAADQLTKLKDAPFSHSREINLHCNNLAFKTENSTARFREINFNSQNKLLQIGNFDFIPDLSMAGFASKVGFQKDRYDIRLAGISLSNIDLDKLLKNQIIADALTINNSNIKIGRDLRYKLALVSKVGNYPHQMLLKSKMPIDVRKANLNNLFLEYEERNPMSDSSGKIRFMNSSLQLSNITNVPGKIAANRIFRAEFTSGLFGRIPIRLNIDFDLTSRNGAFKVKGNLGKSDAKLLNQVSRPLALMEINSGVIDNMNFDLNGNDNEAKGDFELRYSDVKVRLLKIDEETGKYKKKSVMSIVANTIIKNDNPHKGELRSYIVQYDRDPYKSFFNLIWKSVFSGIQETMGFPKSKERNVTRK